MRQETAHILWGNMTELDDLRAKVEELRQSINQSIKMAINGNQDELRKINQSQLNAGEDAKGISIRPLYASSTIKIKKRKAQPFDRVTLRDEGEFYAQIQIDARDDEVEFSNNTFHAQFLTAKYGDDILGVNEAQFKVFFNRFVMPEIKKNYDQITNS